MSGCKDLRIVKSEFVAKTHFLSVFFNLNLSLTFANVRF